MQELDVQHGQLDSLAVGIIRKTLDKFFKRLYRRTRRLQLEQSVGQQAQVTLVEYKLGIKGASLLVFIKGQLKFLINDGGMDPIDRGTDLPFTRLWNGWYRR